MHRVWLPCWLHQNGAVVALSLSKRIPTPDVQEQLNEVASWLRVLARIFGLDLTQGASTDPKTGFGITGGTVILVLIALPFVTGCATTRENLRVVHQDPRAEYVLAEKSLESTMNVLTDALNQGAISHEAALKIARYEREAQDILDEWNARLLAAEDRLGSWDEIQMILRYLGVYEPTTEQKGLPDGN